MIETITVITLGILFLVYFRPGKTPPLENQLVIERPGKYKIILAPRLNLAQPFIEAVIDRLVKLYVSTQHGSAIQYFAVSDKQVAANHGDVYLLAIIVHGGMLYFLAAHPLSGNPGNYLETIRTQANDLLRDFPASDEGGKSAGEHIVSAIMDVAQERDIAVDLLSE
jgi:hypothetical protein